MLEFVNGDFFEFDADVRINTVNCVGVMGAGVALAFKKKYPDMYKFYVKQCKAGEITPGNPSVWKSDDMFAKGIEIINFPTKDHWRRPSEYEYIDSGLRWLSDYLKERDSLTITLPALGCGHGGLDWERVKNTIQEYLGETHHRILVFEPVSSKNAGKEIPFSSDSLNALIKSGINTLEVKSAFYPGGLRRYTERSIYIFGGDNTKCEFDISIIASTKPSENEKNIIFSIINYCKNNNITVLFGGSAFDKKTALTVSTNIDVGVFIPSGILKAAENLTNRNDVRNVKLLSIGDPFESFDRKAYIPSVLSRMFISKVAIFTTDRLDWLKKHKKLLNDNSVRTFYVNYEYLSEIDKKSAESIHSKSIELEGGCVSLEGLNL